MSCESSRELSCSSSASLGYVTRLIDLLLEGIGDPIRSFYTRETSMCIFDKFAIIQDFKEQKNILLHSLHRTMNMQLSVEALQINDHSYI
jgi:hypothetical protein